MPKISNTTSYPNIIPSSGDYLVLTDISDSDNTKTVTIQAIADFIGGGGASIQSGDGIDIDFGTVPSVISADLKTDGGIVFESTELAVDLGASSITGTLAISDGGTSQTTRQAAINTLTNSAAADTGYVLTSDGNNANFQQISVSNVSGTLAVESGGTGASSLTDGGILLGSGTSAITVLGQATNGQIPIGSTGGDPVLGTITAGSGISVTNGSGSIEIASTSSGGTVTSIDVSGGTTGLTTTGGPVTTSGTITVGGTLAYTSGGTGLTTLGVAGQVLKSTGTAMAWQNIDPTTIELTSGATVTWDYRNGSTAFLTLGSGNADAISITGLQDGSQGVLILDGSSNTTVLLPTGSGITSKIINGGSGYTPSANIDVLRFVYQQASQTFYWTIDANLVTYVP
jgi:hypothetical protein|tara:strand:+ start:104 stop:1303 length:1200 start_codon:yes stop_codon:yes gene_type:complete